MGHGGKVFFICFSSSFLFFSCDLIWFYSDISIHWGKGTLKYIMGAPRQKVTVSSSTESRVPAILCGAIPEILATITVATVIMYWGRGEQVGKKTMSLVCFEPSTTWGYNELSITRSYRFTTRRIMQGTILFHIWRVLLISSLVISTKWLLNHMLNIDTYIIWYEKT